ncbi:MAG: sulfur carrier protein ThiS [Bacteroidetes bacterium]|nr:sulfur carrier protein ThiS [Bacteroidota bacterium]
MIEVLINQEKFQLSEGGCLADVLPLLHIEHTGGIAIAVNEVVIPKKEWEGYVLQAADRVFVIKATQGG